MVRDVEASPVAKSWSWVDILSTGELFLRGWFL